MLRSVIKAMRPEQWVKNLLVFVPMLMAHRYLDLRPMVETAIAFVSFSLGASAIYLLNDLVDLEADRQHPHKRHRPFASGALPTSLGAVLIPLLAAASLISGYLLSLDFMLALIVYFVLTTLYSLRLKQVAILDILILAALYTLRIIAGSAATGVVSSEWLLGFSMFLFLSLGAVKRYGELKHVRSEGTDDGKVKGRGYLAGDLDLVIPMGISSGYLAVLVLAMYIASDTVSQLYSRPVVLWFICPLMLFWISRIWLLAHRGEVRDDPLTYAVKDGVTWVVAVLAAGVLLIGYRGG